MPGNTETANRDVIRIALAQIAPVLLDRDATLAKVVQRIEEAAARECRLVAFGEALVPGYPIWLGRTNGARFDAADQKELHALYLEQAVQVKAGHLDEVCRAAAAGRIAVVLGTIERPSDRGGHSLYCSRIYINSDGSIGSVHRKLMPTHEERLAWGMGDGAGLVTHRLGPFTVGALNCWENWLPLARAALYAAGEDLHIALWPGSRRNTIDITRFIALESRSFVASVSCLIREPDVPAGIPQRERIAPTAGEIICDGGSCLAGPDGRWIVGPTTDREQLITSELDHARVREERQNLDVAGHYSRPDVLRLTVDRRRQATVDYVDLDAPSSGAHSGR
jgi:nitrilase